MNKSIYLTFFAILFLIAACKHETDIYTIYRPSNPQNFKTSTGNEAYAFAVHDSLLVRADYYLKMMGQLRTYGSKIVAYGFCWHPTNRFPVKGADTTRTTYKTPLPNENDSVNTFSFSSVLTRMTAKTDYYIRSYVVTLDSKGDSLFWYNPVVRKITTKDAIDEWFEQSGNDVPPAGFRFDALAFNLGDTIFFGTGNQGQKNLSNQMYMYDPTKSAWELLPTVPTIQLPAPTYSNLSKFTNGIGFAIEFKDNNSASTKARNRFFYVGLADYEGGDNRDYKSIKLIPYDLINKTWLPSSSDFSGGVKSGAVCFVIGSYAYIGTGSNSSPTNDWHVFSPADDRDGVPTTLGWQTLAFIPSTTKRVEAVAFTINGRGYFGLGKDDKGNFLSDFYEFRPNADNPRNGTWSRKADFPGAARENASAFVIGDQGYVGTGDAIKGDMESSTYTGAMYADIYRYDPFNNKWHRVADYTANKTTNINGSKKVTRGVGFAMPDKNFGYIGFGIDPAADPRAQEDLWQYKPFDVGKK